jgi:FtsP/CotA-like multicopper oxidase with cupredoxin domain
MNLDAGRTDRHPAAGGLRDGLIVALLLTAGVIVWWRVSPPEVLAGGAAGMSHTALTALLVAPLALVAAIGGAWLARRGGRHAKPSRGPWLHAAATAGLFAALLLATAPAQRAAHESLAPPAGEPNLAAIRYDASCPPIYSAAECRQMEAKYGRFDTATLAHTHKSLVHHTGHSTAATEAMYGGSDGHQHQHGAAGGADATAHAVQDAALVLLLALPVTLLGLYGSARLRRLTTRVPTNRGVGLGRVRSRWSAAVAAVLLIVTGNAALSSSAAAQTTAFTQPLRIPPVLRGSEVTLQMREADVQIMPTGPPTRMWTYNGIFPGPTIRRPSGQTTRITFRNSLPASFGEATVHHHGSHSRPSEDGQPDSFLIPPGAARTYRYDLVERREPEWAVTQWYHDHRMDVTGRNVWNGLAGLFIVDDRFDSSLPLPRGEFDVPLVIVDRTFDANNQIPYTFSLVGTLGDRWLVNGNPQPHFNVGDRKYRIRVLNAANRRPINIALSNGQPLTQIATDSGLMAAPVQRPSILLQPAERAEFIVDFAGLLGQNVVLRDTNTPGTPGNPPPDLMQFRVTRDLTDTSSVPATLRPVPTFPAPVQDRSFVLRAQTDSTGALAGWTINGQRFDSARIDANPVLNTTERWTFFNDSPQPHAIHLHDVDWRLERRFQLAFDANGNPTVGAAIPVQPYESGLKETFMVPPATGFSVLTTFTDHVGPYVFHCHMLEHEDMAMMAQFSVRPPR